MCVCSFFLLPVVLVNYSADADTGGVLGEGMSSWTISDFFLKDSSTVGILALVGVYLFCSVSWSDRRPRFMVMLYRRVVASRLFFARII